MTDAAPRFQRELITLGTSSQVPTRHRNHNAYVLRLEAGDLLFDPGEGTQQQIVSAKFAVDRIHTILVSHFHGDHSLGLAGVFVLMARAKVAHRLRVVFPASGQAYFERQVAACEYTNALDIEPVPVFDPGVVLDTELLRVHADRLSHGVDTFGYRIEEKPSQDPSKPPFCFAHVMDTRRCKGALALAAAVDVLLIESTYLASEAKEAVERGHLTASQAAEIARDAGAKSLILSHFSQRYPSFKAFREEARRIFPRVRAARDLARYQLD